MPAAPLDPFSWSRMEMGGAIQLKDNACLTTSCIITSTIFLKRRSISTMLKRRLLIIFEKFCESI